MRPHHFTIDFNPDWLDENGLMTKIPHPFVTGAGHPHELDTLQGYYKVKVPEGERLFQFTIGPEDIRQQLPFAEDAVIQRFTMRIGPRDFFRAADATHEYQKAWMPDPEHPSVYREPRWILVKARTVSHYVNNDAPSIPEDSNRALRVLAAQLISVYEQLDLDHYRKEAQAGLDNPLWPFVHGVHSELYALRAREWRPYSGPVDRRLMDLFGSIQSFCRETKLAYRRPLSEEDAAAPNTEDEHNPPVQARAIFLPRSVQVVQKTYHAEQVLPERVNPYYRPGPEEARSLLQQMERYAKQLHIWGRNGAHRQQSTPETLVWPFEIPES